MPDQQPTEIVARYLACLDRGAFEQAANQFTESVTYHSPIVDANAGVISGRDDLLTYFHDTRPAQGEDAHHHIVTSIDGAGECAVFGIRTGEPDLPFVSYAEVRNGKISTYAPGLLQEAYWTDLLADTDAPTE